MEGKGSHPPAASAQPNTYLCSSSPPPPPPPPLPPCAASCCRRAARMRWRSAAGDGGVSVGGKEGKGEGGVGKWGRIYAYHHRTWFVAGGGCVRACKCR